MNRCGCATTLEPLGDAAVVLKFDCAPGEALLAQLGALTSALERDLPRGVLDVVPAFATVTVFYDPMRIESYPALCGAMQQCARRVLQGPGGAADNPGAGESSGSRVVEIPVCYGGEFGPDLNEVAARAGLATEQVVALHRDAHYFVQAIGFAPGFAYLGGLPERLHTPRRATPRTQVPAGALGIGGALTGVYPLATPGGWNLIGRTPLRMFDPARCEPALLRAGDRARFRAITPEEFAAWK